MRDYRLLPLVLVLGAMLACASIGVPPPATFNQKADAGLVTVNTILKTTDTLLVAGKLSAADAKNVEAQADNVAAGIAIARSVHATDPPTGDSKLLSVLTALQALQAYLTSQGSK